VQAIANWKVNVVRIPLNEDCWLGINGATTGGPAYQKAITDYVTLLNSSGMVAIVELHWNAPGAQLATGQQPMADADHSISFWTSVANTFKSNNSVIFELYNEPNTIPWDCWKNGGTCNGAAFQVAGMQQMLNAIRQTGATNIVAAGGLQWSNDMTGWLANAPSDPLNNLAAVWHVYNFNACVTASCWDSQLGPVIQKVPLITTEIGENDCKSTFIDQVMAWLDSKNQSYLGWAWVTADCSGNPSLISDYLGTPTTFGAGFKNHLATVVKTPAITNISMTPSANVSPSFNCLSNTCPTLVPLSQSTSAPAVPPVAVIIPTSAEPQVVISPSSPDEPSPIPGISEPANPPTSGSENKGLVSLLLQFILQFLALLLGLFSGKH
jgi:hypothetical protein